MCGGKILQMDLLHAPICMFIMVILFIYVTGFMKTGPNRTRTEIHFIA